MKSISLKLIALMLTISAQPASAGVSNMINSFFTFRQDQKPLIAPERTLPPKHIISPNYDERASESWASYYTRPDLKATPNMDSSSMVMRVDPNYRPPKNRNNLNANQGYAYNSNRNQQAIDPSMGYAGIQRRAKLNNLEKYSGNVYIGDPGMNPFNLNNKGKAGLKTTIGKPKRSWQSASSNKIQPRIGDYDYVKRHQSSQNNNAFGEYSGTLNDDKAVEVTRSTGYFERGEVPLPTENNAYYNNKLPKNYIVKPRDSLSGISGQKQIYGDWKMWPLIYDENRTQIKDPDLIHPGQDLAIPRGTSSISNDRARARAENKKAPYSFYDGK